MQGGGDDDTSREHSPAAPRDPRRDDGQAALHDRYERQSADDRQPLLSPEAEENVVQRHERRRTLESAPSTAAAPSGGSAASNGATTRASAASARILNAIPQFSQWLQDVNSHATQLQMHGLRRQGSSGGGAPSSDDAVTGAASSYHTVDLDGRDEDDSADRRRDLASPQSRRRGAPVPRSVASLPSSTSFSASVRREHRASLFEDGDDNGGPLTPVPRVVEDSDGEGNSEFPSPQAGATPQQAPATAAQQDNANSDDQSAIDELHALFRRCHHSLPFVGLFIVYFAYQHTTGIVVFVVGTVAIVGLDQRIRAQVALKEKASALHLAGIVAMCVIDTFALCCIDGDPNPLRHFARMFQSDAALHDGTFWDVLWTVIVNDFIIRLCSVAVKAVVAVIKSDSLLWLRRRSNISELGVIVPTATSPRSPSAGFGASDLYTHVIDLESQSTPAAESQPRAPSSITFYRRKRKLYGIIELASIFARSLLAGFPWCIYYQLCSSKFVADTFTFGYILIKGMILGTQGRKIAALVRSFVTLGLEFGVYVSHEDLVEAGSPDCSICYEEMHQPVKLSCSHMFCEECVMEWFDRERSCPLCRANMASTSERAQDEVKPQFLDGSTSLFPQLF